MQTIQNILLILKPLQIEKIELISSLSAKQLAEKMKLFQKNNMGFTFDIIFRRQPNLDVHVNLENKVEISSMWQFTQLPGFGMNVNMTGNIVAVGNNSKIVASLKPHFVYVFLFWSFLLIGIISLVVYVLRLTVIRETLYTSLIFTFLVCPLIILFCSYNKKQLIKEVSNTFSLTLISSYFSND